MALRAAVSEQEGRDIFQSSDEELDGDDSDNAKAHDYLII